MCPSRWLRRWFLHLARGTQDTLSRSRFSFLSKRATRNPQRSNASLQLRGQQVRDNPRARDNQQVRDNPRARDNQQVRDNLTHRDNQTRPLLPIGRRGER